MSLLIGAESGWYVERGRSLPSLEPVTAVPRVKLVEATTFGAPSAIFPEDALLPESVEPSESATGRTMDFGVPGCGNILRCFGLVPLRSEGNETSSRASL